MRAGVAASRKLKPKVDESAKLTAAANSNHHNKSRRNHNGTGGAAADVTKRSTRHRSNADTSQNVAASRQERYAHQSPGVTRLDVPGTAPLLGSNGGLSVARHLANSLTVEAALKQRPQADTSRQSPTRNSVVCLVRVAHSADAFMAAGAAAKGEERLAVVRKQYYRKAIALMAVGGFIFLLGVTFAALFFAGYKPVQMAGPICLAIGLLLGVCGLVWIPIIKTKLKRKQQMMTRTFSL